MKTAPISDIFNLLSPDFIKDPYYYYSQLPNDEELIERSPGYWITKDYQTIDTILKDRRFKRNFWKNKVNQHGAQIKSEFCLSTMGHWMLLNNPPDHTRLRGLIAPFFHSSQMEKLRKAIEETANGLIDGVMQSGSMDIINQFSLPLTMEFIYQILGIPIEQRKALLNKTHPPRRLLDPPTPLSKEELDLENFNMEQLEKFIIQLCALRRSEPRDDLISYLLNATEKGLLSEDECISQIILLLFSGFDTVPHMIGNSILALHQHPEKLEELKSDPNIFPNAINELLRYVPPVHMTSMEASEDITLANVLIKAGDKVTLFLAAANRDPKIFNAPDTLDFQRKKIRILSFSVGIHMCIGMHLAQMLFEIGLSTLIKKLPSLRLIDLNQPDWNNSYTFRGLKTLKAEWAK